jgi:hypothetical protein
VEDAWQARCPGTTCASESERKLTNLDAQDISGKSCLCNFYGMDMTTDKIRSLVKKWQVLSRFFALPARSPARSPARWCVGKEPVAQVRWRFFRGAAGVHEVRAGVMIPAGWRRSGSCREGVLGGGLGGVMQQLRQQLFISYEHLGWWRRSVRG